MVTNNAVNHTQKGVTMYDGLGHWTQGAYPQCHNIGIAYSSPTFTVQGSDGTALSATNPGYVVIQDPVTPGRLTTILVTANQTFTDGTTGTTDNQRFGLVTGNIWGANDIPFFLYAVVNSAGTAIAFMISRNPTAVVSPAAASIGQSGAIVNVGQSDMFSLPAITASDYAAQPVTYIGCFRMRFVGATDSWTVQAISTSDGVGRDYDNAAFAMPAAVQGAAAGSFFYANGGTAPIWTSQQMTYVARRNGLFSIYFAASTNTTAGAGAVTAILALPYSNPTVNQVYDGYAMLIATGTNTFFILGLESQTTVQPEILFFQTGVVGNAVNTVFGSNTTLNIQTIFKAY